MAEQILNVKIISPQDVLFYALALSVTSKNSSGDFDILAEHSDFITIIENQPILIRTINKKILSFQFPLAVIYTTNNNVSIFAQIESPTLESPSL